MAAEGAREIVVVTDEPLKYGDGGMLPAGVTVHHRDQLDAIQLRLRDTEGVTVLIYDQTCATEKRRRRKRGTMADPARRAFINDAVCEGCGDCSVKSNCLSVEPLETDRAPSAASTSPRATRTSPASTVSARASSPPRARRCASRARPPARTARAWTRPSCRARAAGAGAAYGVLVTGVGGTGVVTIGGLLGMAAHRNARA